MCTASLKDECFILSDIRSAEHILNIGIKCGKGVGILLDLMVFRLISRWAESKHVVIFIQSCI